MPAPVVLKVVLTHRAAARTKYGASGWSTIRAAVTALVRADQARGVTTRFFALDSAADCRKVGATATTVPTDVEQVKATVDRIYAAWQPAYLVLLGGPDLVPLVNLTNPLWTGDPNEDPDPFIPSDLPYACDTAYSATAATYRGPTRVVGRIADLTGVADPSALVAQLAQAARHTAWARLSPEPVFAVSARVWQGSTTLSLAGLPDVTGAVQTSPAAGPGWTVTQTSPRLHLVNCHGGEFDPDWYGQAAPTNWTLPKAVEASLLPPLVTPGQVVAAECCYGTAHWPPSAAGGQAGAAMTYLVNGAAAVFGASTVAYGPATSNDYADVVCRMFLEEVLNGASTGRAVLAARQRFVQSQPFLDPTDVKTLAQFNLLGDPSAVPYVGTPAGAATPKSAPSRRRGMSPPPASAAILARRETMSAVGAALDRTTLSCSSDPQPRARLTHRSLGDLLGREVRRDVSIRTFDAGRVDGPLAPGRTPRAHVAFVPGGRGRAASLVVVREQPGGDAEVRVVVRR